MKFLKLTETLINCNEIVTFNLTTNGANYGKKQYNGISYKTTLGGNYNGYDPRILSNETHENCLKVYNAIIEFLGNDKAILDINEILENN